MSIIKHFRRWLYDPTGAATIEFALVIPLVFTFCFAAVEFGRMNMIRNTMENAAYEGARAGIVPGAKTKDCRAPAQKMLDAIGVENAKIKVKPAVIKPDTRQVTVIVKVPLDSNGLFATRFFQRKLMTRSCTLTREGQD